MSELRERNIAAHIEQHYPNSRIVGYDDPDSDLVFYTAEELQSVEGDWFPLSCHKDPATGKAVYGGRKGIYHTYVEGETGAGKTTRFVMQSLLALSSLKGKPSFVVVDIHGEIIENLYAHLKKNGYEIKILNCDDPTRSDTYNPFSDLVKECLQTRELDFEAINRIRRIAELIQPVQSSNDPIWDMGARSYTNGAILDKFEDLLEGNLPPECLTLYNIIQTHYWLRRQVDGKGQDALWHVPHYKRKGPDALSVQKIVSVANNAERTRGSYFGVIENHYDVFGQTSLFSISSNSTIDIDRFLERPTAIIIQSGNTNIGDHLISLLMNDIYSKVVKEGKKSSTKRLPRNIHCFLDEFANCNIADGPEFIKMLTTTRKFGMFWHMILQCDAQLDRKYDPRISRIIRANSTEVFMGAMDHDTLVRFARSCGQKTIESLASRMAQGEPRLEVVDLLTADKLDLTEEGYAYIKGGRHPLMKAYTEAFYNCDEFIPLADGEEVYPHNDFDYKTTLFYPTDILPSVNCAEYEILRHLGDRKVSLQEITAAFPMYDVKKALRGLTAKRMIRLLPERFVSRDLTEKQWGLCTYRYENGFCPEGEREAPRAPGERPRSRNPFDPDFSERSDPNREFEKWCRDAEGATDTMYGAIKHHLTKVLHMEACPAWLDDITMLPDSVRKVVHGIFEGGPKDEDIEALPARNTLKFEVIEAFLTVHDFPDKPMWEKAMEEELGRLVSSNIFPKMVMDGFRQAVKEVCEELTMGQIREIKKIIDQGGD